MTKILVANTGKAQSGQPKTHPLQPRPRQPHAVTSARAHLPQPSAARSPATTTTDITHLPRRPAAMATRGGQSYGFPIYCAGWLPLAHILKPDPPATDADGDASSSPPPAPMAALGGGGGEGRSGVPNKLVVAALDTAAAPGEEAALSSETVSDPSSLSQIPRRSRPWVRIHAYLVSLAVVRRLSRSTLRTRCRTGWPSTRAATACSAPSQTDAGWCPPRLESRLTRCACPSCWGGSCYLMLVPVSCEFLSVPVIKM